MPLRPHRGLAPLAIAVALASACATSGENPVPPEAGAPPPAGGTDASFGGDDAASIGVEDAPQDAGCPIGCSPDLHDVVDCNGTVLKHCPSDQGCDKKGGCVAACDSANVNKSTIGCDYYSVDP